MADDVTEICYVILGLSLNHPGTQSFIICGVKELE